MSPHILTPNGPEQTRILGASLVSAKVDDAPPANSLTGFNRKHLNRDDLSGVQLGPYELGPRLGAGGMGTLFHARHRELGKACAVKFIHPAMATNGQAISRFLQEIKAVGQLNHPHIVSALDAGCCDGVHYYVTELLVGKDLQKSVAANGPMTIEKTFDLIRQVSDAMAHAHECGFIHRDIKPSNIFLTEAGHAKLLDFGLARNTHQPSDGLTSSEQLLGTLDYLAPEQAENPTQANAASDIYSLGLTWIYLLSGQTPFPDAQYATTVSKLRGQLVDQPQWLSRNPLSLSPKILALLSAMIAKDPASRIKSCREVIAWLNACSANKERSSQRWQLASVSVGLLLAVVTVATMASIRPSVNRAQSSEPAARSQAKFAQPASTPNGALDTADSTDTEVTSSASESAHTLSNARPTANAKVVRRPGTTRGSRAATQSFPLYNNKN